MTGRNAEKLNDGFEDEFNVARHISSKDDKVVITLRFVTLV